MARLLSKLAGGTSKGRCRASEGAQQGSAPGDQNDFLMGSNERGRQLRRPGETAMSFVDRLQTFLRASSSCRCDYLVKALNVVASGTGSGPQDALSPSRSPSMLFFADLMGIAAALALRATAELISASRSALPKMIRRCGRAAAASPKHSATRVRRDRCLRPAYPSWPRVRNRSRSKDCRGRRGAGRP